MYATISADIVSSTSLSGNDTIAFNKRVEELFELLTAGYHSFWGRQVKGDYIECTVREVSEAFRIALIIKTAIKSFECESGDKEFHTYGVRMSIGIGGMRIVDKGLNLMDGEAIYLSGRAMEQKGSNNRGTLTIRINDEHLSSQLHTVGLLTDALINNATKKQCEVIYYKLQSMKETDIAAKIGIKQSSVNKHSTLAKWYCIEEAVKYFEQIDFNGNG